MKNALRILQAGIPRAATGLAILVLFFSLAAPFTARATTYTSTDLESQGFSCSKPTVSLTGAISRECKNPTNNWTASCTQISMAGGGQAATNDLCEIKDAQGNVQQTLSDTTGGLARTQINCTAGQANCDVKTTVPVVSAALNFAGDLVGNLIAGIAYLILIIAGFLVWVAGGLFNWVVVHTVFQFSTLIGNSPGLLTAWGVLRDIGNIALLFGFIFMGIGTILDLHTYSAKRALPALIIFAVLLNFSLFAAEAVIDASNVMASLMYNNASAQTCDSGTLEDCAINVGIAGQVLQGTGISSIFGAGASLLKGAAHPTTNAVAYVGLALFVTIAAVVLLAGAIMLIIRAVVLTFLMALAPIGFAGMAVPPLHGLARQWWDALIKQSFFAPIYILLVLISLKIMEGINGTVPGSGGLAAAIAGGQGTDGVSAPPVEAMGAFMIFALLIGFLIAAMMLAKQMGAVGANFAIKTAGSAVYGTMGFVGRRTAGRASNWAAERIRKSNIGKTETGRFLAGFADRGAKSSFDFRGTGAFKAAGVDLGKANKVAAHGYHGIEEKAVKERADYAKSLIGRDKTKEEKAEEAAAKTAVENATTAQRAAATENEAAQRAVTEQTTELARITQETAAAVTTATEALAEFQRQQEEHLQQFGLPDVGLENQIAGAEGQVAERRREQAAQVADAEAELAERRERLTASTEALAAADTALTEAGANRKATLGRIEGATSKKAAQLQYAETLKERGHGRRTFSVSQRADHHAASAIFKDAGKSELLKTLESFEKAAEKKDDHGDEGHAAPAPAARGGGGGHGGGGHH